MKKSFLLIFGVCLLMTSCYCNKVVVGNVSENEELVHVKSVRNPHVFGLIVNHDKANHQMGGINNYVIESKTTIGDILVGIVTLGIYTPNTTKYYVSKKNPRVVVEEQKKFSKAYKGHLK